MSTPMMSGGAGRCPRGHVLSVDDAGGRWCNECPGNYPLPAENAKRCVGGTCCGTCDRPNRRFYVTVMDGGRIGLLVGPFRTHQGALDMVDGVRAQVVAVNLKAHFYDFGTCLVEGEAPFRPGRFNDHLTPPFVPEPDEPEPLQYHTHPVVFGRSVPGCPRCRQLAAGANPRTWGGREYDRKLEAERRRRRR